MGRSYHNYPYKRPRGDAFFKRRGLLLEIKNQLSGPVAMGDNRHLQPLSRLPECIMAGELKILQINLKSEEIVNCYLTFFTDFNASLIKIVMFCYFLYFSYAAFDWGSTKTYLFSESQGWWLLRGM